MAIWRNSGLEQLFGAQLDETSLTEASLHRLIALQARESEQLDFKEFGGYGPIPRGPNDRWTREQEFCKDVFAFANQRGGVIVIGMRERDEVATELRPQTTGTADDERQRLFLALRNNGAPWVDIAMEAVHAPAGGYYLVVVVPPSPAAPHGVLGDGSHRSLRFPVRAATDIHFMPESQVAARYADRAVGEERAQRRHRETYESGLEALNDSEGIWLTLAVSPQSAAPGVLSRQFGNDTESWLGQNEIGTPCGDWLLPSSRIRVAAPGRVTFRSRSAFEQLGQQPVAAPLGGYAELHVSGGAFLACAAGRNSTEEFEQAFIGVNSLVDWLAAMVDVGLRWAAHRSGEHGLAELIVGFHGCQQDGSLPVPMVLADSGRSQVQQVACTRQLRRAHSSTLIADLAAATTVQRRLEVTFQAACLLLQQFGTEEPSRLRADGALLGPEWGDNYRAVRGWARAHDVACEVMRGHHGESNLEFTR